MLLREGNTLDPGWGKDCWKSTGSLIRKKDEKTGVLKSTEDKSAPKRRCKGKAMKDH